MKDIFETIENYQMIEAGMRVIAGVSGGADSVCLLYVLSEYRKQVPFELQVVHVEHGIRGEASLSDAVFTQELCGRLEVPCRIVHTEVQKIAAQKGLSVEEAGRQERYRIFAEVCSEIRADRIAVAHNRNDQAETMLWNLARGSGLKGLGGIRPVRGQIIRPLLFTDRRTIERIVQEGGLDWRTDQTNLEQEYTRNKIRLSLIPQMERELNEQAGLHLAQAAERLQQVQELLERLTQQAALQCLRQEADAVVLLLEPYEKQETLIQTELLKEALIRCRAGSGLKDIGSVHLQQLQHLAELDCGKECCLPGQIRAVRENGRIRFHRIANKSGKICGKTRRNQAAAVDNGETAGLQNGISLQIPGVQMVGSQRVTTELLENTSGLMEQIKEEKKYTKWISYDTINSNVCLRTRKAGDYLAVNETGGRKKLKDYFIDCKVPRDQRDAIWLLADGAHILWVIGYRLSSEAKITQKTKKVLKIQVEEVSL